LGVSLSLFNLVALLLVTGISIDYALFFAHSGDDKLGHQRKACTLQSIVVSACSSLIVFGLLTYSTIPVLQTLGLTVTVGVFCSFILTFIGSRQRV